MKSKERLNELTMIPAPEEAQLIFLSRAMYLKYKDKCLNFTGQNYSSISSEGTTTFSIGIHAGEENSASSQFNLARGEICGLSFLRCHADGVLEMGGANIQFNNAFLHILSDFSILSSSNLTMSPARCRVYLKHSDLEVSGCLQTQIPIKFSNNSAIKAHRFRVGDSNKAKQVHNHFLFMRHGETSWVPSKLEDGPQDLPLNDSGRAQVFDKSQEVIRNFEIDKKTTQIYSSPLKRCMETAEIMKQKLMPSSDQEVEVLEELRDINYGHFSKESAEMVMEYLKKNSSDASIRRMSEFVKLPEDADDIRSYEDKAGKFWINTILNSRFNKEHEQYKIMISSGCFREAIYRAMLDRPHNEPFNFNKNYALVEEVHYVRSLSSPAPERKKMLRDFHSKGPTVVLNGKKINEIISPPLLRKNVKLG